jgi:hypothetical protein
MQTLVAAAFINFSGRLGVAVALDYVRQVFFGLEVSGDDVWRNYPLMSGLEKLCNGRLKMEMS